jgi:cell division protein FtsB
MKLPNPHAERILSKSVIGLAAANAISAFIICYCVVSFIAGKAGLFAYRDLASTMINMEARIASLGEENARLLELKTSYKQDFDRIAREARDIGYLRQGEKIIVLPPEAKNLDQKQSSIEIEPIRVGPSTGLPDSLLKTLAALASLAVFLVSLGMSIFPLRHNQIRMTEDRS